MKKKETARKTAVSEYQLGASGLSQHLAKLKAEIKTFEGELQMHNAAAVRRLQPIDPNNADSFDYEREDPGTDDDDGAQLHRVRPGGGRVRFPPLSFMHGRRAKRRDAMSKEVKSLVKEFFEQECATS